MSPFKADKEQKIEQYLRKHAWILYLTTFLTAATLYWGIYGSMLLFDTGNYWSLLLSGLLAHSFFVITMHDGAHKSITRTKFDYVIMNFCAGLIILPIYTELFKKYHLLHHAHTNTDDDPLWTPFKAALFRNKRLTYALLQCVPFAFNLYVVLQSSKDREKKLKSTQPNKWHLLLSIAVAIGIIVFVRPNVWFVLGTFTVMTSLGAIRYWEEHMGVAENKDSNTHWFPLGMGIGNHEVHHHFPGYSWLTLTIGMFYRDMDTHPIKTVKRMFFDPRFRHYKKDKF